MRIRAAALLLALLAAAALCGCARNMGEPPNKAASSAGQPGEPEPEPEPEQSEPEPEEPEGPKSEIWAEILASGTYYIDGEAVIEMEGMSLSNPMLIAVDGESSSVSVSSDLTGALITIRTLTLDGKVYMINDAAKSYSEITPEQAANSWETDFSDMEYLGEGTGDFCGEQLEFEEYEQGDDIIRLFMDGERLAGLTRTIEDEQLGELTLKIKGMSQNIPARMLEPPMNYQKQ